MNYRLVVLFVCLLSCFSFFLPFEVESQLVSQDGLKIEVWILLLPSSRMKGLNYTIKLYLIEEYCLEAKFRCFIFFTDTLLA